MTHKQTQVSTNVLTHKIYYEDPKTKQIKTHYCDAEAYSKIRRAYAQKSVLDLGNGKSLVWSQFRGGDRIDPQEYQSANASTYIRQSHKKVLRVNGEYEIITWELVDKKTRKVLKTDTKEKLIHPYTKEDIIRYQKIAKAIKNRRKDGKTISEILKESLNF